MGTMLAFVRAKLNHNPALTPDSGSTTDHCFTCKARQCTVSSPSYKTCTHLAVVPLAMQALPAVLLIICMLLNSESPRYLAKMDDTDQAIKVLSRIRNLPPTHPYVKAEMDGILEQLDQERRLIGGSTLKDLLAEMWHLPGNRKRLLLSISLMIC